MEKKEIVLIAFILIVSIIVLDSMIITWHYNVDIGSYFELSDKASKLDKKLDYLLEYQSALVEQGLYKGQSTILFQTRETSLEENYKVLGTLVTRMQEIENMEIDSWEYQKAIEQITEDEYCWFHTGVFLQGYYLQNSRFWLALTPSWVINRCSN